MATAYRGAPSLEHAVSSALLTDRYELTMLSSALSSGTAHRRSVFELFARNLPHERRYGVVSGTGRFLTALEHFHFDDATLAFLEDEHIVDGPTLEWLADFRFSGDIWGYAEGDCYFPGSPILVVEADFAEAVLLETLALSIYNHDSAIATAASRMVSAADDRPIIEMGSRRTHEFAAVAAARAAYIAGFASTSNLAAGRDHGIPTAGTSAHAFTLLFQDERSAFEAQLASLGNGTTLLVDTYDIPQAVRTGLDLAGADLGAVRIDSGDLAELAVDVRSLLDDAGANKTRIVVTGDLDEYAIAGLAVAPVDGYGVGTALVTGSGAPTAALVYKLAARALEPDGELLPVAKRSPGKPSRGGRKWPVRRYDRFGVAQDEVIYGHEPKPDDLERPRLRRLVASGEVVGHEPVSAARERHRRTVRELPLAARHLSRGEPALTTVFVSDEHEEESA
ncbi:nicotinate phosphoribosyltransferase [Spiractinospora alimapuensis]|uniref:nicotinate phosphoribosyltransferase n=1 Tax=Spiractinospora alimapuensis TaxID=2820884 RepID=UPI001EE9E131|nr:nicotinate phosphoribosyltransferase [Spiractinospora alimapuensis]QVQ54189.1 nicotinate phosphoribosyltransferase [Spiractinospora alimapuensis]